jgi:1-deoxy-D-xylulose-5-phosphate synthase
MLLPSIRSPRDLRGLDAKQLETLASEIRAFIVDAVSRTGGHLGSNLGAVELTLALHRVFDSPRDVVLWDTGHQAYVHKIITGRQDGFAALRQSGGLSGYPSRAESDHDWVENSHASTILSYAYGFATGFEQRGVERRVVAVVGDGALTGGMAFEALNNLGHSGRRVIIVLNDNGRSYAPTISRLGDHMTRLRLNPSYVQARRVIEDRLRALSGMGDLAVQSIHGLGAALREMIEPHAFFEALDVRYTGPIDGHDIARMEQALRHAATYDGPIVVHVRTQKGRGYAPAETDVEKCLHDISAFDRTTGRSPKKSGERTYTQVFSDTMVELAERHDDLIALTAAMPGSTGLLPLIERYPDRVIDVGIAEQHAVTAAAGMAMSGLRPVFAVYSTFLGRAFDQMNLDAGLHGQPVVFALDRAGITGPDGASHHGVLDIALSLRVPGMTIFAPSSAGDLRRMLADALTLDGPALVRFPKGVAREVSDDEIGNGLSARRIRHGKDLCILAVGKLVASALHAAEQLAADGISVTVWDVRVVKPLDTEMLDDAARHRLVVTVEDGVRNGGAGSWIAGALSDRDDAYRTPPLLRLGTPDAYIPHGTVEQIHTELGLDATGIAAAARKALSSIADARVATSDGSAP